MMLGNASVLGLILIGFLCATGATTISDRKACGNGDTQPNTRVNTGSRLSAFRDAMKAIVLTDGRLSAFIVGSSDAHDSEYTSEYDKRRKYMTGFGGSAGRVVITTTKAALWTDSRYFLEADDNLDCNWILMKSGINGTPTISEWLNSEMSAEGQLVGVDKTLVTYSWFKSLRDQLKGLSNKPVLIAIDHSENPVDKIWTQDRPSKPMKPINAYDIAFAGVTWQDKIKGLRGEMAKRKAKAFVVAKLDETAWLFNLRGSDIPYNPFFLSYAIVETNRIRLYLLDKDKRLTAQPTDKATDKTLAVHLATSSTGTCSGGGLCVEVVEYDPKQLETDLKTLSATAKVWIPKEVNYAIYDSVVEENRIIANSPVAIAKSIKNPVERAGMQKSSDRDAAVLISFLAFLEKEIADGNRWTELTAAVELSKRREAANYSRGLSFNTISSYGPNAAINHYSPSKETDRVISDDSVYLLDSGGQYLDGSTDVTRTMHYGKPTNYQKECYTLVLASTINLASIHWPKNKKLYGRQVGVFASYQLWDVGLDFRHGTGHGVGAYLSIHEGPGFIGITARNVTTDYPLTAYQFFSDEPGYYEDYKFGFRLETMLMVSPFKPEYDKGYGDFLHFKAITLVPFETKMIEFSLLTKRQVEWLNNYNTRIRSTILPLLSGDQLAIDWVNARTGPITSSDPDVGQAGTTIYPNTIFIIISTVYILKTLF